MKSFTKNMFENELAEFYDLMHQHRDYDLESDFTASIIQSLYQDAKNVLDVFCGTGEHAVRVAQKGYKVTGIDASQDMIDIAVEKTRKAGLNVNYQCADINKLKPTIKYDAAYCLGYTFLYILTNIEVTRFFKKIHNILVPGGVFLVDFISGWSLIKGLERDKFFYKNEKVNIFQFEQTSLNKHDRLMHIEYCYLIDRKDGNVKTIFTEEDLRIFFDDEVKTLMSVCGFNGIKSFGEYEINSNSTIENPNIIIVVGQKK